MKAKVSVALATYNGSRYLKDQLESIAIQTCIPDEIVISDDCSADDTLDIIKSFAEIAPFKVRWFRNEKMLAIVEILNLRSAKQRET